MNFGPFLIMTAAGLWAIDALIRTPLTQSLTPISIVFWEHTIGFILLSPLFYSAISQYKTLNRTDWTYVILLTIVSSVAGTVLFTTALAKSFATGDFITPLLLQKIQPLVVIALSVLLLKEKMTKTFIWLTPVALVGSYLMSFGLSPIRLELAGKELVYVLSLGAAICWGGGTILSKLVLRKLTYPASTALRFLAAIPISFFVAILLNDLSLFGPMTPPTIFRFIIIAFSTGAVALLIYYRGLATTDARIATIAELTFPITSLVIGMTILNPYGAPQILDSAQITGVLLLLVSIILITSEYTKQKILIDGTVIHGSGDGKKLGFPTANIAVSNPLTITYGVYAVHISVSGKSYQGVMHFGPRLIFGEQIPQCEVHIFKFRKNIYDRDVQVRIDHFIRKTLPFSTKTNLIKQIELDVADAQRYFSQNQG